MKKFTVTVIFDGTKTTCEPTRLGVDPGDVIQWTSPDGDLAMDFGIDDPFTSVQVWKALRGELTPPAVIKPELPSGRTFRPAISINGRVVAESLGVIVRNGEP